jgi:DNA polymerase I-like protein with 3'-5' exonuclease and polymerase domains
MPVYGDEEGLWWKEDPIIKIESGKKSKFDANAPQKGGYSPPSEYRSILGLDRIGLDIETKDPNLKTKGSGARREDGKVVGVAIAYSKEDALYYPTDHANRDRCVPGSAMFYEKLKSEAAEYRGVIGGANLQYDLDWLHASKGIEFPHATFQDVQVAEPLLDEERLTYKLEALAQDYLGEGKKIDMLTDLYGAGYIANMDMVDPGWAGEYAEADATIPLSIFDRQAIDLESQGLTSLFQLESRLTPLLLQMRQVGVRVDIEACEKSFEMTKVEAKSMSDRIKKEVGFTVDVWSADQIARAFTKAEVPFPRTPTGRPSFTKDWLAACPAQIGQMINAQRSFEKIGGTFLNNYILEGHHKERLHCSFHQLKTDGNGTGSGRLSSSGPNLQNIPVRHPILGPLCRSIFLPEEDHDWGCVDWSQIEYRFLVHYAASTPGIDAEAAVNMYLNDKTTDFHEIAAQLTGVPRKQAKNINFGVVYGMGGHTMAANLGCGLEEATLILESFHEKFPFLKSMYNAAQARAASRGYISTILGRRRRFNRWELNRRIFRSLEAANEAKVKEGIRGTPRRASVHKTLNALLQGSAADLMKKAMVEMKESGIFNVLVPHLTVHDEMNVSIPRTAAGREAFKEMVHIMETTMTLKIPVLASFNTGANWNEAK